MSYYADTNCMWRRFDLTDARQPIVKAAMDTLINRGESLAISAQNLIEYRAVATRPTDVNGLGLTAAVAATRVREFESVFSFLPDTPDIYLHWRTLVEKYDVKGKQVHDTRLVAVMLTHGITHLLTFNSADFRRFSEITVVEPQDVR